MEQHSHWMQPTITKDNLGASASPPEIQRPSERKVDDVTNDVRVVDFTSGWSTKHMYRAFRAH